MKSETKLGKIIIDNNTIAQIAYQSALSVYGVVGFGKNNKFGMPEFFKDELATTKGVVITETKDNTLIVDLYIIIQYGVNIATVSRNLIEKVKYNIERTTSTRISQVNVHVQNVKIK